MIPLLIFVIKLIEYFVEARRVSCIANKYRLQAAFYAFVEIGIWAIVFKMAFLDVTIYSWAFVERMFAYALGSAFGTYFGIGTAFSENEK